MIGVFLHGPRDLRVETTPDPGGPGRRDVLLRVTAAGICGSDLHTYLDGRIGDTELQKPLILGHEFAGRIEEAGPDARDGSGVLLVPGMNVAVDPAQSCGQCEMCLKGNPNLCWNLHFCGLSPDHGCFCEFMLVPAHRCFLLPGSVDVEKGALLEPLGIALHAVDLARIHVGDTVALFGAGPIGLLILQSLLLAGAGTVFVVDPLHWRSEMAGRIGGRPIGTGAENPVKEIQTVTAGRGVDVAIEAAWGGEAVQQCVEVVRMGGRIVLVGIPGNDLLQMKHSTARRKGLTIRFSRRMKHTYPRAISLVQQGKVNLLDLVSHRFSLRDTSVAFSLNARYDDKVVKILVHP